ncbi:cytochrome P450 [Neorhizobium galegae]|uniref:Unspecific monooxygenase n=1 Tax=Neorhizobium galegae bv. orientalis str. HAMBI 540 TaxID=1028800 RepID=A0A068SXU7_NEOGA|nr:cytochrome P450 [Neorhizobium galegae]MCQ1852877.1 cytochrome P450 [Neorhizobium galegae]CDN51072.1 Unspecific monooxygenase [Neorhizobium galegae bv. orientalis str. HAMBI 540]CDZ44150.1 Cytochrome P450 [Neorhizobium galegae bv. orientalis]
MNMIEGHMAFQPAAGIPVWDIDPYAESVLLNSGDYYAELRARGPLVYIPKWSVLASGRYEETREIFSDHNRFVSSRGVGLNDFKYGKPWRPPSIILEVDPPDHTKTRKVMARALSPKAIAGLKEDFRRAAERIIDQLIEQGSFEAVAELAEAFPVAVFPKAVGMIDSDRRRLVDYGAMVFNALGPDNKFRLAAMAQASDIVPWITAACARDRLTKDGLGALIYGAADDGEVTEDEAAMLVRSFLSAGVDTTVTGIGSALWCLASNPQEFERLKADPSLARPCFEEVLRFTSPVHTFTRTANQDTEVAGLPIAEGTKILCALASANLDPAKWGDPEVFRIDRKPVGHMAFGAGIHGCVGQNLARLELEAVLSVLAERVDHIEFAGEAVWRPNNAIRALDHMQLRFIAK